MLLLPQIVSLTPAAAALLAEAGEALSALGLEVDAFGGGSAAVKALPASLATPPRSDVQPCCSTTVFR